MVLAFSPSFQSFGVFFVLSQLLLQTVSAADFVDYEGVEERAVNITAFEGKQANLPCSATGNTSVLQCFWFVQEPDDNRSDTHTLVKKFLPREKKDCNLSVFNVTRAHNRKWICGLLTQSGADNTQVIPYMIRAQIVLLRVLPDNEIGFEAAPVNRTFSIGNTADLECRTNITVLSCQWSFQQEGQSEPLVVNEGPSRQGSDCSLHLPVISYEQVGQWWCGARIDEADPYTYTDTAYVQVEHKEEAFPIEFVEQPVDTEMHTGETGTLGCIVVEDAHIEGCRWYWTPLGRGTLWSVLLREFTPQGNDCSLEISDVSGDVEGLWSCHVKPIHSSTYTATKPAIVTVRTDTEVAVSTRGITFIEGEELELKCLAETMVDICFWKKTDFLFSSHDNNSLSSPFIQFPPKDKNSRDCSLRLPHAMKEHQGAWTCGMKIGDEGSVQHALPTSVTIKQPRKVQFIEGERTRLAIENMPVTLKCLTLSAVQQCTWLFFESQTELSEGVVKFNSTHNPGVYNCSIQVPSVNHTHQGVWQCMVKYKNGNLSSIDSATPFTLTVVKPGKIMFREVAPLTNRQLSPDRNVVLECVVRRPVEECVWLYQPDMNSEAQQAAKFEPQNFNNCSYTVESNRSSGTWTCGARNPGDSNFTLASPITVPHIQQGYVMTFGSVSSQDGKIHLDCYLTNTSNIPASCEWIHPAGINVLMFNETGKYSVEIHPAKRSCFLSFKPMMVDYGIWKCQFSRNNKTHIVGQSSIMVLNHEGSFQTILWKTTALVEFAVLLLIILALLFCRHHCSNDQTIEVNRHSAETRRYSEDPTKGINFSFNETPELLVDFAIPTQDSTSHHYERVGRFLPSRGSFYQNVS